MLMMVYQLLMCLCEFIQEHEDSVVFTSTTDFWKLQNKPDVLH